MPAEIDQSSRPIGLEKSGANSANTLVLQAVSGYEEMSRPFCYEVDLLGNSGKPVNSSDFIGKSVTLRFGIDSDATDVPPKRLVNCYVARFASTGMSGEYPRYRATLVPFLWFLSRRRNSRIFQNRSVLDIVEDILTDHGFDGLTDTDVDGAAVADDMTPEYTVQYQETDLDFVSRLLEHFGLYYYFTHTATDHRLVISDSVAGYLSLGLNSSTDDRSMVYEALTDLGSSTGSDAYPVMAPGLAVGTFAPVDLSKEPTDAPPGVSNGAGGGEQLWDWRVERQIMPWVFRSADFTACTATAVEGTSNRTGNPMSKENTVSETEYPNEWYEYGENVTSVDDGTFLARVRAEREEAASVVGSGVSDCWRASAGRVFEITNGISDGEKYLITRVEIQGQSQLGGSTGADLFRCAIRTIPASTTFRPERITARPRISGPQSAVVVGGDDGTNQADEWGRVQVQFHWDRGPTKTSRAVRVSQAWAGGSIPESGGDGTWGSLHLPHAGDEVLVEFLEGDPDRPVVTGRVYRERATSPLPCDQTGRTRPGEWRTRSIIKDIGGNYLMMEEKQDSQQIELYSPKSGEQGVMARVALGDSLNGWRYQDSQSGGNGIGGSGDWMDSALDGINARSTGHAVISVDQTCNVYSGGDFRHSVATDHYLRVEGNSETAFNGSRSQLTWTNSSEMTLGTTAELFIGFTTSLTIAGSFDATLGVAIEVGLGITTSAFLGIQGEVFYGYSYGRSFAIKNEEDYTLKLKKAANEIEETVTKMVTTGLLTINNGALTVVGPPPPVVPAPSTPPTVPPAAAPPAAAAAPAAAAPAAAPAAAAPAAIPAPVALAG